MPMERITKSRLAQSLDNAIRTSVGIRGLNTLIYGWLSEVQDLSDYAGYDLLTGQRLPDK